MDTHTQLAIEEVSGHTHAAGYLNSNVLHVIEVLDMADCYTALMELHTNLLLESKC